MSMTGIVCPKGRWHLEKWGPVERMKEGLDVSLFGRDGSEEEAEGDSISEVCTASVSAIMFLIAPIRKTGISTGL
jgi:hypothetical protein